MPRFFPAFFLCLLTFLGAQATSVSGQVLIYKIEVTKEKGVNFHTYEGGYAVAPLLGGSVSFLLTFMDGGRYYAEAADAGKLFTAVQGDDRKAVLFTTTGGTEASGAIVAMGDIGKVLRINNSTVTIAAKVAETLKGTLVSASDESEQSTAAADGSIGSAGIAQVKLVLDEERTNEVNRRGYTQANTVAALKLQLERQGYIAESSDDDDNGNGNGNGGNNNGGNNGNGNGSGSGSGTGSGTGNGSGTGSGGVVVGGNGNGSVTTGNGNNSADDE